MNLSVFQRVVEKRPPKGADRTKGTVIKFQLSDIVFREAYEPEDPSGGVLGGHLNQLNVLLRRPWMVAASFSVAEEWCGYRGRSCRRAVPVVAVVRVVGADWLI